MCDRGFSRPSLPPLVAAVSLAAFLVFPLFAGNAAAQGKGDEIVAAAKPRQALSFRKTGIASWYGGRHHGRRTASGAPYRRDEFTAAHRTLPLDTRVRVTNLANGRRVDVRISDRGPYSGQRIIDLSAAAAARLGMQRAGLGRVRIEIVGVEIGG